MSYATKKLATAKHVLQTEGIKGVASVVSRKLNEHLPKHSEAIGSIPKKYIKQYLPKAPVIVEAGAHIGFDTIEMSKVWPKGTIHAFEPVPDLFNQLASNTERLSNVRVYPLALSNQAGTAKIYVSSGASDGSSSLLPPKDHLLYHREVLFQEEVEIKVTTLDLWAEENGISQVDFLWLDMQGHELAALKACPRTLRTVQAIYLEVSFKELYAGSPLYPEVRQWLEGEGFRVGREEFPWSDQGNALFIR